MPTGPGTADITYGPWDGHDESGQGGPTKVVGSLNVVFRDGLVSRRPGRRIIGSIPGGPGSRITLITEYVDRYGLRQVIVGCDDLPDPGKVDATQALVGRLEVAGFATFALMDGIIPRSYFVATQFNGTLIVADQRGKLLTYHNDGSRPEGLDELDAMQGKDAANGVPGAAGYLARAPRARALAVWRNRLVTLGGLDAPSTIGLSADDGAAEVVPDDAPVGGPNVWPATTNFDVITEDGDAIMGGTVLFDRLVVLCRGGVGLVDEDSVAPVLRLTELRHGCVAARSIQNIGRHVLYLSDRKICLYDGAQSVPISEGVWRTLDEVVDWGRAAGAVSANLRSKNEYRLWVPTHGSNGNDLCIIFDYHQKSWRLAAGWLPFDRSSRQDAAQPFDVTAACVARTATGEEFLLTGDSAGNIWLEDVGEDDQGAVFPAYVELPPAAKGPGVETWRDWWVEGLHDGSFVEAFALVDDRKLEEEFDRVLSGEAPVEYPHDVKRLALAGHPTLAAALPWPIATPAPREGWAKFALLAKGRMVRPVLSLPGQSGGVVDTAAGGLRKLVIAVRDAGSRRADGLA